MRWSASAVVIALAACLGASAGIAANVDTPVDPLEGACDTLMIRGRFGLVEGTKRASFVSHASFASADGWVNQIPQTNEAIEVVASGSGRFVRGGLLRRVDVGSGATLDLYVKDLRTCRLPDAWKFVLLIRRGGSALASPVKTWTLPSGDPARLFLRGFLEYDALAGLAAVRVSDGLDGVLIADRVAITRSTP
jgi:hypothetical protein